MKYLEIWHGEPTTAWCDTCLLPSRLLVPLYFPSERGITKAGTFSQCDGCKPGG